MTDDQRGFTLVELIVAMAFFSFMMVIISVGVLQIMRMYQADLSSRRTQSAARLVIEDITREVRNASVIRAVGTDILCLEGGERIIFERQVASNTLRKVVNPTDCNSPGTGIPQTLIEGDNGVLAREFTTAIIPANGNDSTVKVSITVTTANDDDIDSNNICIPGPGSQFCASTRYSNVVSIRGSGS